MKQKYEKPMILIERFTMTQSIAGMCSIGDSDEWGMPNSTSKDTCGWTMPDGYTTIWTSSVGNGCGIAMGPEDEFMGVCYNNPDGGLTVFGS